MDTPASRCRRRPLPLGFGVSPLLAAAFLPVPPSAARFVSLLPKGLWAYRPAAPAAASLGGPGRAAPAVDRLPGGLARPGRPGAA